MIRDRRMPMAIVSFVLISITTANAQDAGRVGLTMEYPAAIGLVWHISRGVAVRPECSFSISDNDTGASAKTIGVGVSGLVYVRRWDSLRAYVSPRWTFQRTSSETSSSLVIGGTTSTYSFAGSFGAQYVLGARFGVFGEAGLDYAHSRFQSPGLAGVTVRESTSDNWGTRTAVGVMFYFK